ncbi:kinase-like domain-containing protein [Haematococcus lacustris]
MGCAGSTPVHEPEFQPTPGSAKYSVPDTTVNVSSSARASLQAPVPGPAEQGNSPSASQGASQSAGPQGSLDKSNHGKPSVRASTDKQPSQLPATLSGSGAGQNGQSTVQGASTPPTNSSGVGSNLKALSPMEANNVQDTLLRVSALIQKFAEGRSERTTPIQGLKRALDLLITDAQAQFASVQLIRDTMDCALLVALIGAPDIYLESNRLQRLGGTGTAADVVASSSCAYLHWNDADLSQPPIDWQQLSVHAGLQQLSAVPIKASDKVLGILTLGFKDKSDHRGANSMWSTYMQLVAASITSLVKDGSMAKYQALVKDLHDTADIDTLVHKVVVHMRSVLGHTSNHQVWYRVALTATNNMAATIFDDLMQVPASLMQRGLSNQSTNSSFKMLKEVQAQAGVMRTTVAMKSTVMKISVHNRQQVMIPDVQKLINQSGNVSIDIFNTRLIKPPTSVLVFPLKVKQHIFGVIFCMSSVQTDFNDVSPRLREVCEVMSPHLLLLLNNTLLKDYKVVQNAQPVSSEGGSVSGSRNQSFSGRSINDSGGVNMSAESFVFAQSRSSTGALVTGLTEKLNQKRIKSSMDFAGNAHLGDLQVTNCLGEGGFAKVFRGLWRGLVVGIKVVCDDGKNEKMVMKNAHEIAILGALSHPNIVQAYTCMTDVLVAELLSQCLRHASPALLSSSALKYLAGMEERTCHIEVIELCDLGNMSTALKNSVFQVAQPDKMLAQVLAANGGVEPTAGGPEGNREGRLPLGAKVHMRTLLLTLIEIASAMGYLHRMGVVHCDLKPANVLLKSSNMDSRGFTTKVSDFGLSRVEDDDNNSSFPFNSCGTAAYVAPEALICNKKVNSSVDVYAFGILMWEMYTGQRPYGNLKQQQLVEEVVMRGLRPKFPFDAPQPYVSLSQACWSGSAHARPTFDEVLTTLNSMLNTLNPPDGSLYYPAAAHQQASLQQPMQYEASNVAAMDAAPANGTPTGYRGSYPQVQ